MRNKLTVTLEFWILVYVEYCLLLFHRFNTSLLEDTYCINHKVFHCSRPTLKLDQKICLRLVVVWKLLCFYLSIICLCCSEPRFHFLHHNSHCIVMCDCKSFVCECLCFLFCFFANSTAATLASSLCSWLLFVHIFTFTFSHLADAFIQSDLQLGNT